LRWNLRLRRTGERLARMRLDRRFRSLRDPLTRRSAARPDAASTAALVPALAREPPPSLRSGDFSRCERMNLFGETTPLVP
jgi:hypothetical protein